MIPVLLPESLLNPLSQLADLVRRYGGENNSLLRAIFVVISLYILEGIFSIFTVIADSVLFAFDTVVGALGYAQGLLVNAFGFVGVDLLGAIRDVQLAFVDAVSVAGPFAPVLAVGIASLTLYIVYRVTIVAIGELPVGSSLVDLLGLR